MLRSICENFDDKDFSIAQTELAKKLNISLNTDERFGSQLSRAIKNQPLGPIQRRNFLLSTSHTEAESILRRKIRHIDDIKQGDYNIIMKMKNSPDTMFLRSLNHPLIIEKDYEYGWQESPLCFENKMYYILSYNIAMIDIDHKLDSMKMELLKNKIEESNLTCRLYSTFAGYHLFITSCFIDHGSSELKKLTNLFFGDPFYQLYSRRFGYKIRLSSKIDREENLSLDFIIIGKEKELTKIISYLILHDKLLQKHRG